MNMFFSAELIYSCFKRLSAREQGGKKNLERSSALFYFLAFDATCKHFDLKYLDFTPETLQGTNHRRQFELEFTRLVTCDKTPDFLKQVIELGRIDLNAKEPEQRISSNFFSVPVKKASTRIEPYLYPNRPKAPLLTMGKAVTGISWGVTLFENWQSNFPTLLTHVKSSTPHIDLALFAIRDIPIRQVSNDCLDVIIDTLRTKYTKKLCDYFYNKFENEKLFAKHLVDVFSDHYKNFSLLASDDKCVENKYNDMDKQELIEKINYLESLLKKYNILF